MSKLNLRELAGLATLVHMAYNQSVVSRDNTHMSTLRLRSCARQ